MSVIGGVNASLELGEFSVRAADDFIHIPDADRESAAKGSGGAADDMSLFSRGKRLCDDQVEADVVPRGLDDLMLADRPDLHDGTVAIVGRAEFSGGEHEQIARTPWNIVENGQGAATGAATSPHRGEIADFIA